MVFRPGWPCRCVLGRLQVTAKRAADLVPLAHYLPGGRLCGSDGTGTDYLQERVFNGIIDPQATEGDAPRFAVVQEAAPAGVTRDVVLLAGVANRQLAAAAPAAQQSGKKGRAVFGCTMMPALRDVVADHFTDRLCPFPTHVAFMRARLQCKPFFAVFPANGRCPEPWRCLGFCHRHKPRHRPD